MKKLIKLCVFLLCVVAILATSKIVGKANEAEVDDKESVVVTNEESKATAQEDVEEKTFTYRLYVDKLDMYTYNKGHNGKHYIEYSINGGEVYNAVMKLDVVAYLQTQPLYVAHYVDIENVKEGDVVEYEYSYHNTYLFPEDEEPSIAKGKKVVQINN